MEIPWDIGLLVWIFVTSIILTALTIEILILGHKVRTAIKRYNALYDYLFPRQPRTRRLKKSLIQVKKALEDESLLIDETEE